MSAISLFKALLKDFSEVLKDLPAVLQSSVIIHVQWNNAFWEI